jgi:hydrophobic/amphiphilic exporter-1 (mainly G- bacteria), HAE1 family
VSAGTPGTFGFGNQASLFEQGLTAGRTIDIEISGPELPKLIGLGGKVIGEVQKFVPKSQAIPQPSLDLSSPEIHIVPKWEQAGDLGVSAMELGYAVNALVDGAYAGDYYREGIKIDLSIIGHDDFVKRTQALEQLCIATPSGDLVPLGSVAEVQFRGGPEQINRRQRQRAITIQVKPPQEMPLEEAMVRIQREIVDPIRDSGALEGGVYQINLAGTADKLRSTWKALSFNVFLAILITYLLMAALFESWLYPFVVILSVPLGAVGGFFGLWLLNQFILAPLDVLTMLGFVILIGTVVNNPILIVEQALVHMRTEGMHYRQAVLAGVRSRIRPIFMTTMTTVLGLLPLTLFPGAGSELYRGIGSVLIGGLLVSTFVTLVVVPAVFTLMLEAKDWLKRRLGMAQPAETGEIDFDQTPVLPVVAEERAVVEQRT